MQRAVIFAAIFLTIAIALVFFTIKDGSVLPYVPDEAFAPAVRIAGTTIHVEIADEPEEQRKGLSGRDALAPGNGMLFVFDRDDTYGIWMKDMRFAIDVLWVVEDGTIVDIRERVTPETYPDVFSPKVPARYVLEVPADFVDLYGVRIGDRVDL